MSKKINLSKEELEKYLQNHSRKETAQHFNISLSTIQKKIQLYNLPRKILKYKDINQQFTKEQIEILIGSMLGDGSLTKIKHNSMAVNSRFSETHSLGQYGLLQWKQEKLQPFSLGIKQRTALGRKIENNKIVNDSTKILQNCTLTTIAHPFLTEIEKIWYLRDSENKYIFKNNKRIKILPKDLKLSEKIISVWYFDDGSHDAIRKRIYLNTQSFTKGECQSLIEHLKSLNIFSNLHKNRNSYVITIAARSYLNFINLVSESLPHECMYYKIDLSKYKPPDYSTRFQPKN